MQIFTEDDTVGLCRQIIAPTIVFYALASLLGMGLTGIWWGIFLVTWSATIFTLLYVRSTMNTMFVRAAEDINL